VTGHRTSRAESSGASHAAGNGATDLMRRLTDPARRPDPYPVYAELRKSRVNRLPGGGYALGRYRDVNGLLHDPRISSDPHNLTDPGAANLIPNGPFIQRDPPDHDRLRAITMRHFGPPASPEVVSRVEPEIRRFVDRLVGALPRSGEADLVDHLAYPLPVSVICGLLGVPKQDEPQFHAWTEDIVKGLDAQEQEGADELVRKRDEAQGAMYMYVSDLIGKHRKHADGSMLSNLANDDAAEVMTDAELATTSLLLLVAGHETTVNLTANGILTLLRHPWALERLRGEPDWATAVVEELLRYEPPVQYLPNRIALADIEVDGTTIRKGERVTLLLAAASRDPERFASPDRFNPDRPDNQHMGFGSGLHYCFGAPLARIEAQISLTAMARRLSNPRLRADPPPYRPSPVLRGPVHLPVTYEDVAAD
jgi:cytochrome P450